MNSDKIITIAIASVLVGGMLLMLSPMIMVALVLIAAMFGVQFK